MTNYRRLLVASGLSNLGDGVFQIALPLVALGITRDPGAFASVTVVQRLPWLFFALPAGALADRLDRRRTMCGVDLVRALLIGLLAVIVAVSWEELWILYVLALALGVGETLFDTAAQSILPMVVPDRDRLSRANGRLYAVELVANQFVGPPLGGILAGVALAGALAGSAATYLGAAAALAWLAGGFRPERSGPPTRLGADIVEGVRYLFGHRVLRTMALCVGLSNLAFTSMFSVFPLYAVEPGPMGLSEAGFGLLLVPFAVGSALSSMVVERIEASLGRLPALVIALVTFPLMSVAPAVTATWWVVGASFVLGGFTNVMWNVITVSLRQRIAPGHMLGRVNAGYRLLAWGTMPVGAALGGILGELLGLRGAFWVSSALSAACLPLFFSGVSSAAIDAALRDAEPAPVPT